MTKYILTKCLLMFILIELFDDVYVSIMIETTKTTSWCDSINLFFQFKILKYLNNLFLFLFFPNWIMDKSKTLTCEFFSKATIKPMIDYHDDGMFTTCPKWNLTSPFQPQPNAFVIQPSFHKMIKTFIANHIHTHFLNICTL